jgi:hypothetical protein
MKIKTKIIFVTSSNQFWHPIAILPLLQQLLPTTFTPMLIKTIAQ